MSLKKLMPLLLAGITPFVIASGAVRAAEPQIVLAQNTTKEQQDAERRKQEKEHQQQHQKPAGPEHATTPHPNNNAADQQKRAQELKHAEETKALEARRQAEERDREKSKEHRPGTAPAGKPADAGAHNREEDRLRAEQAKARELEEQRRRATGNLQQAHKQEGVLRHGLSADELRLKADRDARRADRDRLIEKQRALGANERSPTALNDRMRIQNERFRSISAERHEFVDAGGHKIIQEPGNRTIFRAGGQAFIRHDEAQNFRLFGGTPQVRRAPNGNSISNFVRPDGSRIEIEVDGFGPPIRRVRFLPDGRRFVLFENRALAVGVGIVALGALAIALPPPHIVIPREQYIVDAGVASEDDIYGALDAPPVEPIERTYELDEVLASVSLRERLRSINIDTINFEFGSWELGPEQGAMLESVAAVIRRIVNDNPGEVFLIEGHTDAVGSDEDNLSLSDRRAEAVADVLSQQFGVPRENLITQGYGKQFLLIPSDGPERRNRRVVVRRLTPLLQAEPARVSSDDGPPDEDMRR